MQYGNQPAFQENIDDTGNQNGLAGARERRRPRACTHRRYSRPSRDGFRGSQYFRLLDGIGQEYTPPEAGDFDAADLLVKSIDVMQAAIARFKLAAYAPDKTIDIPRNAFSFFEFHRAEEMADLGYEKACKVLKNLRNPTS
jgi:predicted acylesterase/phospholipase RssA